MTESVGVMEPMLPPDNEGHLSDRATTLCTPLYRAKISISLSIKFSMLPAKGDAKLFHTNSEGGRIYLQ